MYENYTRQALPSKEYRELLWSAICVFNSNNQFIIENILRFDNQKYNWYDLTDETSWKLLEPIKNTITKRANTEIANLFSNILCKRNRIIHSFQITKNNEQILHTKDKNNKQYTITEKYLLKFIKDNSVLSDMLYKLRSW